MDQLSGLRLPGIIHRLAAAFSDLMTKERKYIWMRYGNVYQMGKRYMLIPIKSTMVKTYVTPAGDTVYGGGGIMPDIFVPIDTATYPPGINRLFVNGSFQQFCLYLLFAT